MSRPPAPASIADSSEREYERPCVVPASMLRLNSAGKSGRRPRVVEDELVHEEQPAGLERAGGLADDRAAGFRALAVQDVRQPRDVETAGEVVRGEVAGHEVDPVGEAGGADDPLRERARGRQVEDRRAEPGVREHELHGPGAGAAAEIEQPAPAAEVDLASRPGGGPQRVAVHAHQEVLDLGGVAVAGAAAHRPPGESRLVQPVPGGDEVGVVADHEPDVGGRIPHEVGPRGRGVGEAAVGPLEEPERGERLEERRHAALVAPDPARDLPAVEPRIADDAEDVEPDAGVQREALPVRAGDPEDLPRPLLRRPLSHGSLPAVLEKEGSCLRGLQEAQKVKGGLPVGGPVGQRHDRETLGVVAGDLDEIRFFLERDVP